MPPPPSGGTGGGGTGGGTGGGGTGGGTGGGGTGGGTGGGGTGGGTGGGGIFAYVVADGISQVPIPITVIHPGDPNATPQISPYPMVGLTIIFSIIAGEGSLNPETTTTNSQGEASTIFTVGTTPGIVTIQAMAPDIGQSTCGFVYAFTAEIKAEDGTSEPSEYINVGDITNFKAKILPVGLTGEFNWQITNGQQYAQITAGTNSQTVLVNGTESSQNINDVTLALNFKPTNASGWFNTDAHEFVVLGVKKIQYDKSGTWTDVPDPLVIAKETTVNFKAIPDPSDASWPSDKPVWGGSAGALGIGETKAVTFNTASSSATDYKTVTATCGTSSVEAKTIVIGIENVTFSEPALPPDGISTVTATATINPPGRTITWSIQEDDLGCSINSTTGVIKSETTGGIITVRASDSVCLDAYAEAILPVYEVDKIKITPDKAEVPVSETQDFTANLIWFGPDGLEGTTDDRDVTQYFTIQWSTKGSALENIGTINPLTGKTTIFTARAELPIGKSKLAGRVIASAGGIKGVANVSVVAFAKLSYIEAVDANNKSRNSIDLLQMVSENNGERNAVITAYKDNIKFTWKDEEPIWSGFINTEGIDSVTITTNQSGTESAQAGNITKTVNIDIFPTDEQEFTFAGKNVINEISIFSEKLASTFNLSTGTSSPLSISASWKWVDKYEDPFVARNVIVKLTGKTSRFKVKALVPGYGISLPLIDVGLFLIADVGAEATLSYNYDPSRPPANICIIKGDVTVDGSIGAEYKVETYGRLYKIYGGAKFKIPAAISTTLISTDPENPGLSSTGSVGPSTVQIKVKVKMGDKEWKKVFEPWEVMPKVILWEYPKKLGG